MKSLCICISSIFSEASVNIPAVASSSNMSHCSFSAEMWRRDNMVCVCFIVLLVDCEHDGLLNRFSWFTKWPTSSNKHTA